jgi:predicted nucleic acid-binding protein
VKIVFDTEALLIFYLGEKGGDQVKMYLERVQGREIEGLLNIVNLTELYYVLYRKSPKVAEEKEANLRAYGVKMLPVSDGKLWKEAGKIKGEHAVSLADAFAVATAKVEKAKLVTGRDEEFNRLRVELIRIR